MIRITTRQALRSAVAEARSRGLRIGAVPTMGYLHEGHLSLIDVARKRCDQVIVTLFVNPLQFGPSEDLAQYPRDLERDAELARARGADILFAPPDHEMYPQGEPAVFVSAPGLSDRLCGAFRPGHFRGVLTVVAKLLHLTAPDVAVFGRKDFQQYVLIRRMAADLDFTVEVLAAPIVRDVDGLALSSRNVYLSEAERRDALLLSRALHEARTAFEQGIDDAAELVSGVHETLARGAAVQTQYVELVDPATLEPLDRARPGDVLALAAFVGRTRLIDNITLERTRPE